MRLNIAKRLRVVTIYFEKNLKYHKNKFEALRLEACLEGIFATKLTMRRSLQFSISYYFFLLQKS